MTEIIFELIKRLTVFMVISKMILYMDIGKGYEKYTKLFISFMVIVQLISGISFLWKKDNLKEIFQESSYYELWKEEMDDFEERLVYFQKDMEGKRELFLKQEEERLTEAGKAEGSSEMGATGKIIIGEIKIE